MRVIIAGSRTIPPHICDELIEMAVRIARLRGWVITEVVWGKARGVDTAAKRWADRNGVPDKPFPADWDKHGPKIAGFIRNGEMAEYGQALIAITNDWESTSPQDAYDCDRSFRSRQVDQRVVWIEWVDSAVAAGWENVDDIIFSDTHPDAVKVCRSIGFVVHETGDSITVSGTVASNPDQCCGAITIPKVAITQMDEVTWQ